MQFRKEFKGVHEKRVIELATGSGSAINFLPNDNQYTGTDISPGLLRKAVKGFRNAGFKNAGFYVTNANDLPFDENLFNIVLCILSLNFFNDIKKVFQEIKRVTEPNATFICSVPVPERNKVQSTIRGTLYSEEELGKICKEHCLSYEPIPAENGALLEVPARKELEIVEQIGIVADGPHLAAIWGRSVEIVDVEDTYPSQVRRG